MAGVLNRFEGKAALVTGGSRGIGLGIAERILQEGGSVVITGRKQESLDEAAKGLNAGDRLLTLAGNASHEDHRAEAIELAMDKFGRLDHVVGNVGINPFYGSTLDLPLDTARKVLDTNVVSTLGLAQQVWHRTWKENGGSMVIIASVGGLKSAGPIGIYGTSKAALIHLTMQLSDDMAPGVRVNAISPAVVKTRFAEALYVDKEDEVARAYPIGRLGVPEDIGAAAAYFLSDDAAWVTGQNLVADGGSGHTKTV
ncbi:NAD(P)-dependent dehydrogenase (short-subunit alcohol dehydrogenase family) [Antricoccus suffuscus]|uniref:NAD(P)-dependent dehydrogenase (Short-subunit alcohol dehydrogenase family) n=1 Tax=Antricoccus suffuscus TaxID=1629062 RepID=A0A2T1A3M0_9ACTN|nr:SDR family oxidoreductase [Antricoccus suffuscus]PRZ43186.1 NAD(P)-dependent dehydrogenase (short-subunit alcohol dehydrogenase family) [Antricoccus suffuscus]